MTDKKLFGKIAGTAFQAVGTAANVVGGAANLVGTAASVAGKAVSAVGSAANAVGEKFAKTDGDKAPTEENEDIPTLASDELSDEDRAFLETLGLEADCRDEKGEKFNWNKIAEFFKARQKAEPIEPAPEAPELPKEERVWGLRDVSFFQTYMTKKKTVVFYKDLRCLHLKTVYITPKDLGFVGRALDFTLGCAEEGAMVGAFFDGFEGMSNGLKAGAAFGAVSVAAGATPPPKSKPEPIYEIWLEANGLLEPLLLTRDGSKLWANAMVLGPTLDALKKCGVKPELWRNGKKCWSRNLAFTHF